MATHSSILAWRIPWTEEPGGLQSMGSQKLDSTQQLSQPPPSPVHSTADILRKLSLLTLVSWVNSMMGHWVITLSRLTSVLPLCSPVFVLFIYDLFLHSSQFPAAVLRTEVTLFPSPETLSTDAQIGFRTAELKSIVRSSNHLSCLVFLRLVVT